MNLDAITPYLNHYGCWLVLGVVFLESLGLPLPGETFIFAAGLAAAKGMIDPLGVMISAILGTFAANNASYVVGYYGGRPFISKYGKYLFMNEKRLNKMEAIIKKHGNGMLIVVRFIIGLRQLNGLIMGTIKAPWISYAIFNFIGAILWVAVCLGLPYYFGKNFSLDLHFFVYLSCFTFLVLLILLVFKNKSH